MKMIIIATIFGVLLLLIYSLVKAAGISSREEEQFEYLWIPRKEGKTEIFYCCDEDDENEQNYTND